jgi:uncharacterized membrane protein YeaQ/YmgE (transglycosylase-associated protein family)
MRRKVLFVVVQKQNDCTASDGRQEEQFQVGSQLQVRWGVVSAIPLNRKEDDSMGFVAWIVVGLIAGWLAGQVMKGGGYGVLVDIILGILGGLLGGWIFGMLGIWPGGGMIGSIIVAFIGAVILVWITRLLKRA